MIEITNHNLGPVSLMVRSGQKARSFTVLSVPGVGKGKNKVTILDEARTDQIDRLEAMKLISTRVVNN